MNLYRYRAVFKSNYDGDTITVDIDLGMNIWLHNRRVRLFGIDTPELRSSNEQERIQAIKARDFVSRRISINSIVTIETHKDETGKYGRLLGTVILKTGENLNQLLVENGLAKSVNY